MFDSKRFINLDAALQFNFHRVLQVRISFTNLMKRVTQLEKNSFSETGTLKFMTLDTLKKLFILGLQSCLFEKDIVVKNWIKILKNISTIASNMEDVTDCLKNEIGSKYLKWSATKVFEDFNDFLMIFGENFDSYDKGYYDLVTKPVNHSDIEKDFILREWSASKCLAVIRAYTSNTNLQHFIMVKLIEEGDLMVAPYASLQVQHLLFYYHLSVIEDNNQTFAHGSLLGDQTIDELFIILDQIDNEKYPLAKDRRYTDIIKNLDTLAKIMINSGSFEPHQSFYYN